MRTRMRTARAEGGEHKGYRVLQVLQPAFYRVILHVSGCNKGVTRRYKLAGRRYKLVGGINLTDTIGLGGFSVVFLGFGDGVAWLRQGAGGASSSAPSHRLSVVLPIRSYGQSFCCKVSSFRSPLPVFRHGRANVNPPVGNTSLPG